MKNLTWQNPEQLFVAQELINKVKSKCCGIKVPLKIEKYPELANVKRIIFSIRQARVDMHGNLVECEVKVLQPGDNQQLAEEMTRLLKAYHPWKVSFINGEFRAFGIEHHSFPYPLDQ